MTTTKTHYRKKKKGRIESYTYLGNEISVPCEIVKNMREKALHGFFMSLQQKVIAILLFFT